MDYNPSILEQILKARALDEQRLSLRLGMQRSELIERLSRKPEPSQTLLKDIAKELAVPSFIFYMNALPHIEDNLPDFRSEKPYQAPKSRQTVEAIQLAHGIRRAASASKVNLPKLPDLTLADAKRVGGRALAIRDHFGVSLADQKSCKDAKEFFNLCRARIEDKGIFVIQARFPAKDGSGFCIADPLSPIIVINTTRQNRARRLFTLIHEVAHILMGNSGISDPFVRRNDIERFCNSFASNFLLPKSFIAPLVGGRPIPASPTLDDVTALARKFKISQQATVLRLEQIGYFEKGTYAGWVRAIDGANPDFADRGGGPGGAPPQEKVKLAKYGFRFAEIFGPLVDNGRLSSLNLFRASGLKPKYQKEYFSYANALRAGDGWLSELDDE